MRTTVVIPNYNGIEYLKACLNSLHKSEDVPYKIIVVDDGSTDESVQYVKDRYPDVRIIVHETNKGFASSVNTGIEASDTEFAPSKEQLMKPITILLVDDHAVMRMGLASLLETCGDVEVIGDTGDGESAIKKALKLRPDVVLMDLVMPEMDGIETTQRLLEKWPEANVLILTTFATSDGINRALEAGAKGAILKNSDLKGLRAAIHDVAEGKRHCSAEVEQIMTDDPPIPELSSRQQEILNSIVRGLSNPDIARQLGISLPMVKEHLTSLFAKLGVANRTEAVALALRKQLLKI